ncbi:unnamed protein product [Moneuplotes crassus]|uniref:Uncharacterized protein n=1 Tax=Euplotes crassus TaxID=5936 RepID=A0AAD1X9V0_EUPCR|nr:unnamed protein product [Moneuplotes crassus]
MTENQRYSKKKKHLVSNNTHRNANVGQHSGGEFKAGSTTPSKDLNNSVLMREGPETDPYDMIEGIKPGVKEAIERSLGKIGTKISTQIKAGSRNFSKIDLPVPTFKTSLTQNLQIKRSSVIQAQICNFKTSFNSRNNSCAHRSQSRPPQLNLNLSTSKTPTVIPVTTTSNKTLPRRRPKIKSNSRHLKQLKKEQRRKELEEEAKRLERLKRIEHIQNLRQRIKNCMESREKEIAKRNDEIKTRTKEMCNYTPLYKKIEKETNLPLIPFGKESYKKISHSPDIAHEKEVIMKIKQDHKPVRLKEIKQFTKKMDGLCKRLTKNLSEERKKKQTPIDVSKYSTKLHKKVLERDKLHKLLEESEERKKLDLIDKKKRFSKLIADTCKPKISKKKKMEIQERLGHSTSKDRSEKKTNRTENKLQSYSVKNKDSQKITSCEISETPKKPRKKTKRKECKAAKLPDRFTVIMPSKHVEQNVDYLSQLRRKREKQEQSDNFPKGYMAKMKRMMKDTRQMINCLDEETLRKEQKANMINDETSINEANKIWMENIQAKIAYIDTQF